MKVTIENMFYLPSDTGSDRHFQNIIFGVSSYVIWARRTAWGDTISFYVFKRNISRGTWYQNVPLTIVQEFMDTANIGILDEYEDGWSATTCNVLSSLDNQSNIVEQSSLPLWFVEMVVMKKLKE